MKFPEEDIQMKELLAFDWTIPDGNLRPGKTNSFYLHLVQMFANVQD